MITYTDSNKVEALATSIVWSNKRPISDYGSKIPTCYLVAYKHDNGRTYQHRVYVMNYGNSGSAYILVERETLFLDIDTEYALQDGVPHPNLV